MKRAGIYQLFEMSAKTGRFGKCPFMVHQAPKNVSSSRRSKTISLRVEESPWIEDLRRAPLQRDAHRGSASRRSPVTRPINGILNVFPNFHGITLHDHISVLARNTRIHEGEQHLSTRR